MAYPSHVLSFGPEYLIPKLFPPTSDCQDCTCRSRSRDGLALRPARSPIGPLTAPNSPVCLSHGVGMRAIFQAARQAQGCIIFAEGEEERVLRAVQVVIEENLPARSDRSPGSHRAPTGKSQIAHQTRR